MIQATRKLGLHEPIPSSALIWQRLWWSDFLHCLALQLFVEALPKECVVCEPRCGHVPVLECLVLICQPWLPLSTHFQYSKIRRERWKRFQLCLFSWIYSIMISRCIIIYEEHLLILEYRRRFNSRVRWSAVCWCHSSWAVRCTRPFIGETARHMVTFFTRCPDT